MDFQPFDLFFIAMTFAMFLLTVVLSNALFNVDKKIQLGDTTEETKKYRKEIQTMRKVLVIIFAILIVIYGGYHYSLKYK